MKNIIIIDDVSEELDGISKALSINGYSNIALKFEADDCFYNACDKVKNVDYRIVISDVKMRESGGFDLDDEVKTIHNVISMIRSSDTDSRKYFLFLWTTRDEEAGEFIKGLKSRITSFTPSFMPLEIFLIKKDECKKQNGEYDHQKIFEKFNAYLEENKEYKLLLEWEKHCRKASYKVVDNILENAERKEDIKNILSLISTEVAGKNLESMKSEALNLSLYNLLNDKIINESLNEEFKSVIDEVIVRNTNAEGWSYRLNSLLHIDSCVEEESLIRPGDFWEIRDDKLWNFCKATNLEQLNSPITNERIGSAKRGIVNTFFNMRDDDNNDIRDQVEQYTSENIQNFIIGLIDISPSCDFSQNNKPVKNFLFSILYKNNEILKKSPSPSIDSLKISYRGESYVLAWNYKFVISLKDKFINDRNFTKLLRIKDSTLGSIIKDCAYQNSRVGTVSFK